MGYRAQIRSSRSGRGHQKTEHMKAKTKQQKHRSTDKNLLEEAPVLTLKEIVEKTLRILRNLGDQRFAVSPFNQYFDSWLRNLREVLSEFESSPAVGVDEEFMKDRSQILADVERKLAERRLKEASLEGSLKNIVDTNHLLAQIDAEYAAKTREIGLKRNRVVQHLTRNVHDFEEELERLSQMKTSIFGSFSKKIKTQKMTEATQKLNSARK